jgi:hypothetical protein
MEIMAMKMSRRSFLIAAAAAQLPSFASTDQEGNSRLLKSDRYKLDLAKAKQLIASGFIDPPNATGYADLTVFKDVLPEAIRFLSRYAWGFVDLGIDSLDIELAVALGACTGVSFFTYEHLTHLESECAAALCTLRHALVFPSLNRLSAATARELAKSDGLLHFSLSSISTEVAAALAHHRNEIGLTLTSEPSVEAALHLSQHQGYAIEIGVKQAPSKRMLDALSSNPNKVVRTSGPLLPAAVYWDVGIYTVGHCPDYRWGPLG